MPVFSVTCYNSGIWDKLEPRIVEARDAKEAAEMACGMSWSRKTGQGAKVYSTG